MAPADVIKIIVPGWMSNKNKEIRMPHDKAKPKSEEEIAAERKRIEKKARKDDEHSLSEAINVVRDELGSSHNIGTQLPAE